MLGVAKITLDHKLAVVGEMYRQYELSCYRSSLTRIDLLMAEDHFIESGEFESLELDVKKIFETLLAIQADTDNAFNERDFIFSIDFSRIHEEEERMSDGSVIHRISDAMGHEVHYTDESDERTKWEYDIMLHFGSAYINTTITGLNKVKNFYLNGGKLRENDTYEAELVFDENFINYQVIFSPGNHVLKSSFTVGFQQQIIIQHITKDELKGKPFSLSRLNQEIYPDRAKNGHWGISQDDLRNHTYGRHKVLRLFYDIKTKEITYLGNTVKGLSLQDVEPYIKAKK